MREWAELYPGPAPASITGLNWGMQLYQSLDCPASNISRLQPGGFKNTRCSGLHLGIAAQKPSFSTFDWIHRINDAGGSA